MKKSKFLVPRVVNKGKRKFFPGYGSGFSLAKGGFTLRVKIPQNAWVAPVDENGKSKNDFIIAGGVSYLNPFWPPSWSNKKDSVFLGYRPDLTPSLFQLLAGWYDSNGKLNYAFLGTVRAGVETEVVVGRWDAKKSVMFSYKGRRKEVKVRRRNWQKWISPQIELGPSSDRYQLLFSHIS